MESIVSGLDLRLYRLELKKELTNILNWWMNSAVDVNGGFVGKIDHGQKVYPEAPKGAVLNARILWSFSAGYNSCKQEEYLAHAHRAFNYICNHFLDKEYGGVYWTVNAAGQALNTKKQVYAISFMIYALAEYSRAAESIEAQALAIQLYQDLVKHSFDSKRTGYFEAFDRDWSEIEDFRLSEKDGNERKTMNTHLHVLEGYTSLYRSWKDEGLKRQILSLISNFKEHIIRQDNYHLNLFMDDDWTVKSSTISFGHDIEASWLLLEAAEAIEDQQAIQSIKNIAVLMARASLEGIDRDGGMFYELDSNSGHMLREKHWWVQSEAIIGFFNAWQISNEELFLHQSYRVWDYVKAHLLDLHHGEWVWGRDKNGRVMIEEDKAGMWKCPYHNSRACLELIKRLDAFASSNDS
ncbi:mannobiose 2-epimerase [Arcticibacter pallidicorallinus]|uniref:Cellobiose 2-epimerase n=1 Tax=Arcticibacter pallidicorallinus TaxID=1259464 RepID=A0A2T0U7Y3_9SPHI|nr:AGE family epimerase/isomerase [Arcticibacter pallidicorallinus]PRY53968.1 mannobiose 2-epimerase [Arcticibacter pallidicorallinus]